jgi:hypothetical protein
MILTINVNDINNYPAVDPINVTGTSITIGGATSAGVNTAFEVVTDNTMVTVTVNKTGYVTYNNTFRVYNDNLTIEIYLVPIADNNVYPTFLQLIEPCSFNIHNYYTTSPNQLESFTWGIDSLGLQAGTKNVIFSLPSSGTIKTKLTYTNTINSTFIEKELTVGEYRPELNLSKTVDSGCSQDNTCCSATTNSEVTVIPDIALNLTDSLITCTESVLEYKLYDYSGELISTTTYNIPNNAPVDPTLYTLVFTPIILGDYKVIATLTNCCTTCTKELEVKVCDVIKAQFTQCNNYKVSNCSLSDTYTISLLNADNSPVDGVQNITLLPATDYIINTPKDGLYRLKVEGPTEDRIYLIIAYCSIQNCILNKSTEILCTDCNCDEKCQDYCKKRYELNRILPLSYILFNYINNEYSLNRVYSIIDTAKANELLNIQSVIDKLITFCDNCSTGNATDSSSLGLSSTNDCGCS